MKPSRKPAVLRGFVASSLATFAALAGHMTGGGQMPGLLGILVPWVFSFMICVLLAGRKLSVIRLSISVAASQVLFHALFVLGTITPSGNTAPHVHGAPLVLPVGTGTAGVADAMVADGAMWFGHLVALIVTVVALHRGERVLLALRDLAVLAVRWLQQRVNAVLVSPALVSGRRVAAHFDSTPPVAHHVLATLRGRAPPVVHTV